MKKKTVNRLLSCALITSMAIACLSGCGDKKSATGSASFGEVWSAPSTVKILQDDADYADKREAELRFNAVRNEQESQQLLITASKDIKKYDLKVTDLKSDTAVFSKENIAVYNERFIPVTEKQYFGNQTTYVADALIPMEAAKQAGELTVKKGQNAGMWVNVEIPKDTEPGGYTGTFTLEVDGSKTDIPVTLTVHNYTLPDTRSAATMFSMRYDRVAAGELDGSIEMMDYYYNYFAENGISLQNLPMESLTGEEMLACLDKYWDVITSFCLTQEVGEISGAIVANRAKFDEQIFALASASTPEKNYFSKALIYTADEPNFSLPEVREPFITEMDEVVAALKECAEVIANDTSGKYDEFKKIPNWREYVEDLPRIVPTTAKGMAWLAENYQTEEGKEILKRMNCFCPVYRCFTKEWTPLIYQFVEEYDMKLWWYGCSIPTAPAATYQIGDLNLLSARTISWLQRDYDILGNLFWDVAAYTTEDKDSVTQYINVYENPYVITGAPAGDGFLVYPGAPYDIYGPLESMRLMSIIDGMEEYELLKAVEEDYDKLAKVYGDKFNTDDCMYYFYHLLWDGEYFMTAEGDNNLNFDALRAELIQAAMMIEDGVDFAFCGTKPKNNLVNLTYFAAEGTKITVNGEELTREADGSYVSALDLNKNTSVDIQIVSKDGKEYNVQRFIAMPVLQLDAISDESCVADATVSKDSTVQFVTTTEYSTDGTALRFDVNGVLTGQELVDMAFVPYASIGTANFEGDYKFSELSAIQMDVYNPGETCEVVIRLYSGTAYVDTGVYTIINGKNEMTINLSGLSFKKLDETDRISFEFTNTTDGTTPNKYQIYVDNIVGKN